MTAKRKDFIWEQKYRPQKVEDCILPERIKSKFMAFVREGDFPNLLLSGSSGVGKTTIAKALCEELGMEYIFINGSDDSGIDVLRTRVRNFSSSKSLTGKKKVVIFDEADYLNANSTQTALRGFLDEFSKNNIFIFTCNFPSRIIAPVKSRLDHIEFNIVDDDIKEMIRGFYHRCIRILMDEGVNFDKRVLAQYIATKFPDFRNTLCGLQAYAKIGGIDAGILSQNSEYDLEMLVDILRKKSYYRAREWVASNNGADIYTRMMELDSYTKTPSDSAELIIILADYMDKSTRVADQELNLLACICYIMGNCEFNG